MKRIILTGGGTAGHVTPNLAIIPHFLKEGWDVHYIGTQNGIEHTLIGAVEGVTYHPVHSGKLRRYFDLKNFTDPFRVLQGAGEAFALVAPAEAGRAVFQGWLCLRARRIRRLAQPRAGSIA